MGLKSRVQNAWNALMNKDPTYTFNPPGTTSYHRPDRTRLSRGNERSIVTSVINRIALDVAAIDIKHCRLDKDERYIETINSGLNECFNLEANIDQSGKAFMQDIVMSAFDEGCIAMIPVDTTANPEKTSSYDILTMRTGKILQWKPEHVRIQLYNDRTGNKEEIWIHKRNVGIVENPLYSVVNEPNSTMKRLIRKLNILDYIDEQSGSGKLDLIIQLPYVVKSEARRQQAEERRSAIEQQLSGSKYGIAYVDGTERVTQLNRPLENNLMKQIEYLTAMLWSQLNMTQSIMDGTADDKTMLNYYNRTIQPFVQTIVDEVNRKFLTRTARSQGQLMKAFRDPFKLVPVNDMAEIADKFTRNEIMTSNEIRQVIGMKPSDDPKADKLVNSNISQPNENQQPQSEQPVEETEEGGIQNGKV